MPGPSKVCWLLYSHFELIIVDNGSKDATIAIAKKHELQDARIQVFINAQNLGDYSNRNKALHYAAGEYIMFVDSDDKILPDGMERCIQAMLQYPDAAFGMYCPHEEIPVLYKNAEDAIDAHFLKSPF